MRQYFSKEVGRWLNGKPSLSPDMLKQSAENARLKRTQCEEELKRKLRERQAEALTALKKRSGYQIKEKRDKGFEFSTHTCLLSLIQNSRD